MTWFHPDVFADSLSAHQGSTTKGGFHVGGYPEPRVAFRLPVAEGGALLHSIGAYFFAAADVTELEWDSLAAFHWSVHTDSDGVPGPALLPGISWDLGDGPWIRFGSMGYRTVDWRLPESIAGSIWLVGLWPLGADGVVRLGRDDLPPALETLVGYSDNGEAAWQPWSGGGIFVDAVLLKSLPNEPGALGSSLMAEEASQDGNPAFILTANAVSGPRSPHSDTIQGTFFGGLQYADTGIVVGQSHEYRLAAVNGGDTSAWVGTGPVFVPSRWGISLSGSEIHIHARLGETATASLGLENIGIETLRVALADSFSLAPSHGPQAGPAGSIGIRVTPSLVNLPPYSRDSATISIFGLATELGSYSGFLPMVVEGSGRPDRDRWLLEVTATVDANTGVSERGDDKGSVRGDGLPVVTVRPNPFSDKLAVDIVLSDNAFHEWACSGGRSLTGPIEVSLVNVMGATVASHLASSELSWAGDRLTNLATVEFEGTGALSSGVYFCRVTWGHYSHVVPVVLIR
ncbi:MAG: hypothetical protein AB1792_01310 [Candidatus Zixiibacteriota bacterium]